MHKGQTLSKILHFDVAPKPRRDFPASTPSTSPSSLPLLPTSILTSHRHTHVSAAGVSKAETQAPSAHHRYAWVSDAELLTRSPRSYARCRPCTRTCSFTSTLLVTQPSVRLLDRAVPYLQARYLAKFIWKFLLKTNFLRAMLLMMIRSPDWPSNKPI